MKKKDTLMRIVKDITDDDKRPMLTQSGRCPRTNDIRYLFGTKDKETNQEFHFDRRRRLSIRPKRLMKNPYIGEVA